LSFGYIGTGFTQKSSENSGVFSIQELESLKNDNKLSTAGILVDFLVVAGGGGGGSGHQSGAGGGAGGVRCSVDNTGGASGLTNVEDKYLLKYGQSYNVTIGGGSGSDRQNGGRSQLGKIVSVGGGGGASTTVGSGGSGGGAISRNWYVGYGFSLDNHYVFNDLKLGSNAYYDDYQIDEVIFNQGYNGGSTGAGAGGGGAGATTGNSTSGGIGIQTSITGTSIYYGGGGGGGAGNYGSNSNNVFYASGGNGGGAGSSGTGAANRGGGGGGGYVGGGGGSGFVVIRYPDTFADITTIGAGLTYTLDTSVVGYKIYKFTGGSDTITI